MCLQLGEQQRIDADALQLVGGAHLLLMEAVQQFGLCPTGQAWLHGQDEQAALPQAALEPVFCGSGIDDGAIRPGTGAEHRALAGELRGGARRGHAAQRGRSVGAGAVSRSGVPIQGGAGFSQQAVQLGAAGQGRGLWVATAHTGLQCRRAERGTDQCVDGGLQRLQRRHAPRVDFLSAGQGCLARGRRCQTQQARGRQVCRWGAACAGDGRGRDAFQCFQHTGGRQQRIRQCTGVGCRAQLAGVVCPGGSGGDEGDRRLIESLEAGLVQVRLGLDRGTEHGAGLAQAFGVVLLGAAAQREQCKRSLVHAHHLALAAQQGFKLLAQFGEGGVAQPALAGLD